MRRWQILGLLLCGFVGSSGCADEDAGPGVSEDTSWRVGCTRTSGDCGLAYDRHGGTVETAGGIKVSCRKVGSFLEIRLEDEGDTEGEVRRNRGILEITFGRPDDNECVVGVTEYDRGAELEFTDTCGGNDDKEGSCTLEGEMNADGFGFKGSIFCDGMVLNQTSDPDFRLEDGNNSGEPVPLEIVNCR